MQIRVADLAAESVANNGKNAYIRRHNKVPLALRGRRMRQHYLAALALTLLAGSPASAQVVSGVMTVTGAEMH